MTDAPPPPRAPSGLKKNGKRLWRSVSAMVTLDTHEELILLQACRTTDCLDDLADEVAKSDIMVINQRGDRVTHPAIIESRQQSQNLARLVASLRLPSGIQDGPPDELTRPQRRGAARAPYGIRGAVS